MTSSDIMIDRRSKPQKFFSAVKSAVLQIPREHRGFGKQTIMLAKEDLLKTYKGAVIGPLWALVKPVFQLFVYWFAFSILRGSSSKEMGVEYFLFIMSGFVPWFFMSDCIGRGSRSIADNRQFVNKVSFPVSVIMTYTTISKFYVHIFLLSLTYLYITIFGGITPSIYNLQLLFLAPLMFIFFLALTWSLAPMSAFSKDYLNFVNTIMSGLFWLSAIGYDSYRLKNDIIRNILMCNPLAFFVNAYRKALICNCWIWEAPTYPQAQAKQMIKDGIHLHPLWELAIMLVELGIVIALGVYNYNRLRKDLPDVL